MTHPAGKPMRVDCAVPSACTWPDRESGVPDFQGNFPRFPCMRSLTAADQELYNYWYSRLDAPYSEFCFSNVLTWLSTHRPPRVATCGDALILDYESVFTPVPTMIVLGAGIDAQPLHEVLAYCQASAKRRQPRPGLCATAQERQDLRPSDHTDLLAAYDTWSADPIITQHDPRRLERSIVARRIEQSTTIPARVLRLSIRGHLAGFAIYSLPPQSGWAILHHRKYSPTFRADSVSYAVFLRVIEELDTRRIHYLNTEDDLGIAGLRQHKLSLRPQRMLHRYSIDTIAGVTHRRTRGGHDRANLGQQSRRRLSLDSNHAIGFPYAVVPTSTLRGVR